MLTQKEKDIIIEAKELWTKNALVKFIAGQKAKRYYLNPKWEDGTYIQVGYNICPMCREYVMKEGNCNNCSFIKVLGKDCGNSGGKDFCKNPTLETCINFMNNFDIMLKE